MNQQIEKFYNQSMTAHRIENRPGDVFTKSFRAELDANKFAELIVRECAEVVSNQYSEDWGKWSNRMILEHFGVEE